MSEGLRQVWVLGTPLLVTDYVQLAALCQQRVRQPGCLAVDFANTHIVALRRHDRAFRAMTASVDLFCPDGMPLVWCLNRAGAGLKDRVYGPTFMRRFLETVPGEFTHFLLGGSEECGARLRTIFQLRNPAVRFAGGFHGRCGPEGVLEGEAEAQVTEALQRQEPDFIWVGLGTPKQYAWLHRHKPLLRRGVVFTVGFAFDVNAGLKRDAPLWMQRAGLTWIYRLATEPRRLAGRYLKFNCLFLAYLLADSLRGRAVQPG